MKETSHTPPLLVGLLAVAGVCAHWPAAAKAETAIWLTVSGWKDGPVSTEVLAGAGMSSPPVDPGEALQGKSAPVAPAVGSQLGSLLVGNLIQPALSVAFGNANTLFGRLAPGKGERARLRQKVAGSHLVATLAVKVRLVDGGCANAELGLGDEGVLELGRPAWSRGELPRRHVRPELVRERRIVPYLCPSQATANVYLHQTRSTLRPERTRYALGVGTDWNEHPAGRQVPEGQGVPLQVGLTDGGSVVHQVALLLLDDDPAGPKTATVHYSASATP